MPQLKSYEVFIYFVGVNIRHLQNYVPGKTPIPPYPSKHTRDEKKTVPKEVPKLTPQIYLFYKYIRFSTQVDLVSKTALL